MGKATGESSACVRQCVVAARKLQTERMNGSGTTCNAQMKAKGLRDYCDMDAATKDILKAAIPRFPLSGRGYDWSLKVSRTIADLEDSEMIQLPQVTEPLTIGRLIGNCLDKKQTGKRLKATRDRSSPIANWIFHSLTGDGTGENQPEIGTKWAKLYQRQ
jgi:hypothetical protein